MRPSTAQGDALTGLPSGAACGDCGYDHDPFDPCGCGLCVECLFQNGRHLPFGTGCTITRTSGSRAAIAPLGGTEPLVELDVAITCREGRSTSWAQPTLFVT